MDLRNIGILPQHYMASQPTRTQLEMDMNNFQVCLNNPIITSLKTGKGRKGIYLASFIPSYCCCFAINVLFIHISEGALSYHCVF
jgi:hypothetical protein